ncbi:MAG: AraC family transcriptional regulator [Calditrichota bacterium]
MKIISLPDSLDLDLNSSVQIHDYQTSSNTPRGMINLTRNTFSFLLDGHKEVITDSEMISIQNSEFLLMKSGHCLMTEQLPASNRNYRSILLFFSDDLINEFIQKHSVKLDDALPFRAVRSFPYDDFINLYLQSLQRLHLLKMDQRQKLLKIKLEEILLYLIERSGSAFLSTFVRKNNRENEFIQVVESNVLNKLTLKELAFLSNMSVSTFKREFEKQFQESPIKWFQNKRLEHSAYLLKHKNARPSDIYLEIGYENLSNFIHAFKNKFGVTPKQYQSI